MKRYLKKIALSVCVACSLLQSSCVYEDETPCPIEVRFVFDYNMKFADAFPSLVNDVVLFVFDSEGRYISYVQDHGSHLDENYRMTLDLKPGGYKLVAWAGLEEDITC